MYGYYCGYFPRIISATVMALIFEVILPKLHAIDQIFIFRKSACPL
jgi:hypothetical protein